MKVTCVVTFYILKKVFIFIFSNCISFHCIVLLHLDWPDHFWDDFQNLGSILERTIITALIYHFPVTPVVTLNLVKTVRASCCFKLHWAGPAASCVGQGPHSFKTCLSPPEAWRYFVGTQLDQVTNAYSEIKLDPWCPHPNLTIFNCVFWQRFLLRPDLA